MVIELQEYWLLQPPVHELVAAFLEYKPPARYRRRRVGRFEVDDAPSSDTAEVEQFVKSWGGKVMSQDNLPEYIQKLFVEHGLMKIKQPTPPQHVN